MSAPEILLSRNEGLIAPQYCGLGDIALRGDLYIEEWRRGSQPMPGVLRSEPIYGSSFVRSYRADWVTVPEGYDVVVDCSDDRRMTQESADLIKEQSPENMMHPLDGTASIFGAIGGGTLSDLIAGVATYGPRYIDAVGGFFGRARSIMNRSDGSFGAHSSEAAEGNAHSFNELSNEEINCAFNLALGAVSSLLSRGPGQNVTGDAKHIQMVARREQHLMFGRNETAVDGLFASAKVVADHLASMTYSRNAADFRIDRPVYGTLRRMAGESNGRNKNMPVPILVGQHKPVAKTAVIYNFNINAAGKAGNFYRGGIGRVADEILKTSESSQCPEPELLIRAIKLIDGPTRAVLYSHDPVHRGKHGKLRPEGLPMSWIGDPWETIKELERRYQASAN